MSLPTSATVEDIESICTYLLDKPAGADILEAIAVFGESVARNRKLADCRLWGFVEKNDNERMAITERGRAAVENRGERRAQSFLEAMSGFPAYEAVIEEAKSRGRYTITALEVSAFWRERHSSEVALRESDRIEQAICFFGLLEGAGLGKMTIGRSVHATEFDFTPDGSKAAAESEPVPAEASVEGTADPEESGASGEAGFREVEKVENGRANTGGEEPEEEPPAVSPEETVLRNVRVHQGYPVPLPNYTSHKDIDAICIYLLNEPAGATLSEAMAVFGKSVSRSRKRRVCEQYGFIEKGEDERIRITERGRRAVRDGGKYKAQSYLEAISGFAAYRAIIRNAVSRGKVATTAPEVVNHWLEHFPSELDRTEKDRINQATCFFRLLEGAALGELTLGKRERVTRFAFETGKLRRLAAIWQAADAEAPGGSLEDQEAPATPGETGRPEVEGHRENPGEPEATVMYKETVLRKVRQGESDRVMAQGESPEEPEAGISPKETVLREVKIEAPQEDVPRSRSISFASEVGESTLDRSEEQDSDGRFPAVEAREHEIEKRPAPDRDVPGTRRVFIAHGGNEQILDQVKELLAYGKHEAVTAREDETSSEPELEEAIHDIRTCKAAVIHAGPGKILRDESGREVRRVDDTALIEIGAAMAEYRRNVLLLVEEGVELPSRLLDVQKCRFSRENMNGRSMLSLLLALNGFDFD